jgi:hypothetical protein
MIHNIIRSSITGITYQLTILKKKISDKKNRRNDVLYVFYDLEVLAPCFDIIPVLVLAEKTRIINGLNALHIIIVPGSYNGFAKGMFEYYQSLTPDKTQIQFEYLEWRVRNILVPCCWLMPSCKQLTVCTSRKEAWEIESFLAKHIFPDNYLVNVPINPNKDIFLMGVTPENPFVPSIAATLPACDFVSDWIKTNCNGKKVVTITLREATYELDRNSNIQHWINFARSLDKNTFFPVFIRDTETAFQPIPEEMAGLTIFQEACWNLEIRAALYQMSYLNLFVSGGPMILSWFNSKSRFLLFKVIIESVFNSTEESTNYYGLFVGKQPSYFSEFQKIVWADDSYELIRKEFDEMCIKIDQYASPKL